MSGTSRPQLGRLVVSPFATIGVLAAVLTWEIEHVGSIPLSLAIVCGGVVVGIAVARRLHTDMERVSRHYEALLEIADDQSRQAESANRLKDEFLSTLSHELRTPLNSVLGWSRLLAGGKLDAAQTARAIQAIERAGWAQSRLIEDLLDVSRIVAGTLQIMPTTTMMQPLVEGAIDSLENAAEGKRIAIVVSIDSDLGPITADPDRLRQVVWNLLSNAIKFTPSGGRVTITVAADVGDAIIIVEDTGIGFTPEVAAHLFERFRQGDSSSTRQYGGLGLGLGIVRHVVELHGGTVAASSAGVNQGSRFEVRLPIRQGTEAETERPPARWLAPSLKGVSVLLVDDDPRDLEFLRAALEQAGAAVITAGSATEARERFTRARPDVIVSDVMMPGEDGLQLIRAIRRAEQTLGGHTPAAAVTGLARADDRRRALTAGYEMHVTKPVDPGELVMAVQRLAVSPPAAAAQR